MNKAKDCWIPVIEEFIQKYPQYANEGIIDWFPSGQMEITVKTKREKMYTYDWYSKTAWQIHNPDEDEPEEETEEDWRRHFSLSLNRKMRNMGVFQDQLSERTGISKVTISKYMNGKATPSGHNISKLAKALKCSPTELMKW